MVCKPVACRFSCSVFLFLRADDVEFQDTVVFRVNGEVPHREVFCLERVAYDSGNLHRKLFHVECLLGLAELRVRNVVFCSF